jgi:uncharacterized membrane protein YhiD involved in acid resistance
MTDLINLETYFDAQLSLQDIGYFYLDFLLAGLCAFILSKIYQKYGKSLSNRTLFSSNFIILALTTMLIITVVKSSLALSLGVVGALSIVRFRSAIKEPEELTYLFLTMSVGLGFGSGQRVITLLAFAGIIIFLISRGFFTKAISQEYNMLLSVASASLDKIHIDSITQSIKKHTRSISLKRLDQSDEGTEILLYVKFDSIADLNAASESIKSLDHNLKMSFIEDRGLFS